MLKFKQLQIKKVKLHPLRMNSIFEKQNQKLLKIVGEKLAGL